MPIYKYRCQNDHLFEKVEPITSTPRCLCDECGQPARRVIQPVAITFKGSGFYKTDSVSVDSSPELDL